MGMSLPSAKALSAFLCSPFKVKIQSMPGTTATSAGFKLVSLAAGRFLSNLSV